jgi:hypothetical protein
LYHIQINVIYNDLGVAGLVVNPDIPKDHRRYIGFKKDVTVDRQKNFSRIGRAENKEGSLITKEPWQKHIQEKQ